MISGVTRKLVASVSGESEQAPTGTEAKGAISQPGVVVVDSSDGDAYVAASAPIPYTPISLAYTQGYVYVVHP